MNRLFRHIIENWIKYGFETFTILVGIIGALTIDNWNEDRKERKQEHYILQQLQVDFKANQQLIQQGLDSYELWSQISILTLNHTGPEVGLPEPAVLDSFDMVNYATVELVHSTINLILSTDQMELLQNDKLKSQLSSFPGEYAIYKRYELLSREIALKQREIHQKHIAILSMVPDMQTKKQVQHISDYLGWLRDRDHQNALMDRLFQNRNAANYLTQLKDRNENILMLINTELDRFE